MSLEVSLEVPAPKPHPWDSEAGVRAAEQWHRALRALAMGRLQRLQVIDSEEDRDLLRARLQRAAPDDRCLGEL